MHKSIIGALIVLLVALSGALVFVSTAALRYKKEAETKPKVVEYTANQKSFLTLEDTAGESRSLFENRRNELIAGKQSFIEADLEAMRITLYEEGAVRDVFPIVSKGRDGSWWETPTGRYSVLGKEAQHFSSIGRVWMPWSVQFYGNFFIHGWPHHEDGTPVPPSYSGGCIRLANDDAEKVFAFAGKNMPILVLDADSNPVMKPALEAVRADLSVPALGAAAAIVTDLDTGALLLDKKSDEKMPVASLAKLMTATVASELIYLGRSVAIAPEMLRDAIQSYPLEVGKKYLSFDLLYPLLMESSNGSARALAAMIGEKYFVAQMNKKAETLGMRESVFVDPAGIGEENMSTLRDLAKLGKYILEKRRFIFDISRGKVYDVFGPTPLSSIKNFNEFAAEPALLGVKNGKTDAAKETLLTVWRLKDKRGTERTVMIAVLGSLDRAADAATLRGWLQTDFGLY